MLELVELPEDLDDEDPIAVRLETQYGMKRFTKQDNLFVTCQGPFMWMKCVDVETYKFTLLVPIGPDWKN